MARSQLADGAAGVAVGDEVYGLIDFDRDGAAAEYVTLPASELAARSRSVSDAQTATLPLAALTAWQALVDYAAVEPGERILVQGGTGGVGAFAVQLATFLGGRVIATGRGADDGFVRSLGAERFVSTANGRLANEVSGVVTPDAAALARLASLVDDGKLRTIISQSFPLRDGRHAFESGAHPRPPGKTVLIVR